MSITLKDFGIEDRELDIKWRFMISCLKSEARNYQPIALNIEKFEFFDDTDEGKEAFATFKVGIPIESDYTITKYSIGSGSEIGLGGYESLDEFQNELEQLSLLLESDGFGFTPDGDNGVKGSWFSRGYFEHHDAFTVTHENSQSLIDLLDRLELSGPFWLAAQDSMRRSLAKNLCLHDWAVDAVSRYCLVCEIRSEIEYLPQIRLDWDERAARFLRDNPLSSDLPPGVKGDPQKLAPYVAAKNPYALHFLGTWNLDNGDKEKAKALFLEAAKLGNSDSMVSLGRFAIQDGEAAEALKLWTDASSRGNEAAMRNLGIYWGDDPKASLFWHERAMRYGNTDSIFDAGYCYFKSNNFDQAERVFSMGTEKGSVDCSYFLALTWLEANKEAQAVELLTELVKDGHAASMYSLGKYLVGTNESSRGLELIEQAKSLNYEPALEWKAAN